MKEKETAGRSCARDVAISLRDHCRRIWHRLSGRRSGGHGRLRRRISCYQRRRLLRRRPDGMRSCSCASLLGRRLRADGLWGRKRRSSWRRSCCNRAGAGADGSLCSSLGRRLRTAGRLLVHNLGATAAKVQGLRLVTRLRVAGSVEGERADGFSSLYHRRS